ncbi:hypothetical protein ACU4GR_14845 [Methylobacterium oryzae CBMB20]
MRVRGVPAPSRLARRPGLLARHVGLGADRFDRIEAHRDRGDPAGLRRPVAALPLPFSRGGYIEPLNSVGWTLNYEMFFYLVFAGLLLVPRPAFRSARRGRDLPGC